MKHFLLLLLLFVSSAFADSTDDFVRLADSLINRLPQRTKPINLCMAKFEGDDSSSKGELSTFIREELEIAFSKNSKVQVITRSNLNQLELEAEFQDSDLVEQSTTVSKVAVQGVEGIVRGRFTTDGNVIILYAEIVLLEGGGVIKDKVTLRKPGAQEESIIPPPQMEEINKSYDTPPYTPTREDLSDLDPLIANMRALRCREEASKLYQKRLLTLLPLIRNGSDVNVTLQETKGNTALHYSCAIGSWSITKWLVEHGADVNAVTNAGKTPLDCVGDDNAQRIRNLLISRGAKYSSELSRGGGTYGSYGNMDAEELNNIGLAYQYGNNGKPQNYSEAARHFRLAAEMGHAGAQNNLGFCYHNGWGVPKDMSQAAMWYKRSADQGNAWGQSNYGTCLEFGWGVRKNMSAAIEMYRRAAAQGHASAKKHLKRHGITM